MRLNNTYIVSFKKQQGSTLVVAIFIIVVLGALVAALSNLVRGTSESVVVEVLGTRSFFAAQSGLESGMTELYPSSEGPLESCQDFPFALELNNRCKAEVTCKVKENIPTEDEENTHLRLESVGSCTAGGQAASRKLAIETRVKE